MLALYQQPLRWRDLPNPMALLPHQPSANDCPLLTMEPGAAPTALISQFVPAAAEGQGAQAAGPARLSLSRRHLRCRHHAAARLVLPHQAAADGGTETAQRVRRARHRGFHPRRLHARRSGGGRVIDIHALECDEEVIAIFAGVADGHRFSMMFNTYTMSANSKYSPGLILMRDIIDHFAAKRLSRARSRHRIGRLQAAVLQGRRADLRQLYPAQPARQARRRRDVGHEPRQAHGEAQSGAVRDGAKAAECVQLTGHRRRPPIRCRPREAGIQYAAASRFNH